MARAALATGEISGTPASPGVSEVVAGARSCPLLVLEPPVLPVGTLLVPYKEKISVAGGAPPVKFFSHPGALPAGLKLDDEGVLSGTPTVAGKFYVIVVATDAKRCSDARTYEFVVLRAPSRVMVTFSPDRVASGESVTLTATIVGGVSPEGTVTFRDMANRRGTVVKVERGEAVLRLKSLQAFSYPLTADYSGDAKNLPSSGKAELIVVRAKSAVALSSSSNPARPGTPVTFRATVTSGRFPSGQVTFRSGSGVLGTAYLPAPFWAPGLSQEDLQPPGGKPSTANSTELTTTSLAEGTHIVTAEWAGDSEGEPSVSAPVEQRMEAGAPLPSPTPTPTPGPKIPLP